jgi:hypothetical protein
VDAVAHCGWVSAIATRAGAGCAAAAVVIALTTSAQPAAAAVSMAHSRLFLLTGGNVPLLRLRDIVTSGITDWVTDR